MIRLIEEAANLGIAIQQAELPQGERARYIPAEHRIIVSSGLPWFAQGEAIVACLVHVRLGVTAPDVTARKWAAEQAQGRLVVRAVLEGRALKERSSREWNSTRTCGLYRTHPAARAFTAVVAVLMGTASVLTGVSSAPPAVGV